MEIFGDGALIPSRYRGGVVTLGKFDAVHRGHAAIVSRVVSESQRRSIPALAITFDPPPIALLPPRIAGLPLCSLSRRLDLLSQHGLDAVVVLRTTEELLCLTPEEFVVSVLVERLGAISIVEGPRFTFGAGRAGTLETMRQLGQRYGFATEEVSPILWDDAAISASLIRTQLVAGDVAAAAEMLGYPYRLTGRVVHGAARGRTLSFPTANLAEIETLLPAPGVYKTIATTLTPQQQYLAATHIGVSKTFGATTPTVESFLLDFEGDIYGATLHLDFTHRLRDLRAFASADELVTQLHADVASVRG